MIGDVLFLAADLPWPPDGGGRIATLAVLEAMAESHAVDLIALADVAGPDLSHLRRICRRVDVVPHAFTFGRHPVRQLATAARAVVERQPYRLAKFRSRRFAAAVRARRSQNEYALVHHDQFGVALYHDPSLPATLTTQNVESEIYRLGAQRSRGRARRAWARLEASRLRRIEPELCRRFDHVFTLSASDAALLAELGAPGASVLPIPAPAPTEAPTPDPPMPSILTLGSMSWFGVEDGLLWFYREVWPRIRSQVPAATWDLVGPNAGPAIRRLDREPGITVRGYVENVDEVIAATRVAAIPLQVAGGVRIKLLELMARGRPSVATTIGAQGLSFEDGAGCFRRDSPRAFAEAVTRLLVDDDLWRETGRRGWAYVRAFHGPGPMRGALEEGLDRAVAVHAARNGPF